jgi:CHAT domain-containing protein
MLLDPAGEVWDGPFAAIADPIYNTADPRWQPEKGRAWMPWLGGIAPRAPAPGVQLGRLLGSAAEAEASAYAYGRGRSSILLLGEGARASKLKEALAQRPAVIHLATHVVPSLDRPREGSIAFSLSPAGTAELVGAATVASWEANPALVVMSGCRSGGGVVLPGEGLLGLTRAWLRSGAHNVAATLWPTTDTRGGLFSAMYRYLSDNSAARLAPAKALQLAQIEMLRSEQWRARTDQWAAYFMVSRE